jgi:uncharacterized protein (TIGR02302 family)
LPWIDYRIGFEERVLSDSGPRRSIRDELRDRRGRSLLLSARRLWLVRLGLFWEQAWPALFPAVGLVGVFLALAFLDLLPALDGYVHIGVLVAFAAGFVFLSWRGLRGLRLPDEASARRRVEIVNELPHRPLAALEDQLAGGRSDPGAAQLWELHRRRLRERLGRLRLGYPASGLAARDPYALRGIVLLLLVLSLAAGWGEIGPRFTRAFEPSFVPPPPAIPPRLDVWVTPPAYTNEPPIFLAQVDPKAGPFDVPENSSVLAQVQGGSGDTQLRLGDATTKFDVIGEATYRASGNIVTGNRLAVIQNGNEIAGWSYTLIADQPPLVAFTQPPSETERHALRLDYAASDDYGIAKVTVTITRRDQNGDVTPLPGMPAKMVIDLPVASTDPRVARGVTFRDLTANPWAGTPVRLSLVASDATGQTGNAKPVDIILPERPFANPVAKAIIEQRRLLTLQPETRVAVARRLFAIGNDVDAYKGDPVVTLALRVAGRRLMGDKTGAEIPDAQDLLWQTALRLEEGTLGSAEMTLRAAEQALQEALDRGASDEEIEKLMDQLQQAMNQFLDALTQQAMKNAPNGKLSDQDQRQLTLQRDDLQRLLDRAREMAKGGARDAARQMLSQLQDLLENLRANPFAQQSDPAQRQAEEMMRDLGDLSRRQQNLLDKTYRDSQQLAPGQSSPNSGPWGDEQAELQQKLGQLNKRFNDLLGQTPSEFQDAERQMDRSQSSLHAGNPGAAINPETQALEDLQQGQAAMMKQLVERFGRKPGQPRGTEPDRYGEGQDPLGRALPGAGQMDTGDVKVPDKSDLQRAREILEELRRRAGENARPRFELDYLDRLLKRF